MIAVTKLCCRLGLHRWSYEKLSISRRRQCIHCKKKKQDRGYTTYREIAYPHTDTIIDWESLLVPTRVINKQDGRKMWFVGTHGEKIILEDGVLDLGCVHDPENWRLE